MVTTARHIDTEWQDEKKTEKERKQRGDGDYSQTHKH